MRAATTGDRGTGRVRPTRVRPVRVRPLTVLVAVLLALLALAGCAADTASDDSAAPQEAAAGRGDAAAPEPGGDGAGGGEAGAEAGVGEEGTGASDGADAVLPGSGGSGRRVVTSSIDVAVEDVPAAAEQVRALAVRVGGEVADESSSGGESPRAEIVLRVPAGDTPGVMEEVAALGAEVARTAESEPVETRLVDLESRTATQRAGVERIRALLEQATTLEDVLALEAELTRRQADLESVDAQRAALADLAALATVTVRLTTPQDAEVPLDLPPFLQGLRAGWDALVASTSVLLVVLGGLLPFAVVGGLLLAAAVALRRALRRRRGTTGPRGPVPVPAGQVPPGQVPAGQVPPGQVPVGQGPSGPAPSAPQGTPAGTPNHP